MHPREGDSIPRLHSTPALLRLAHGEVIVAGTASAKTKDNPNGQNIWMVLDKGSKLLDHTDSVGLITLAAESAHEGVHVADGLDWVQSGFSDNANPSNFQTERDAYTVDGLIIEGLGYNNMSYDWGQGKKKRTYKFALPLTPNGQVTLRRMVRREYSNFNGDAFSRSMRIPKF